MTSGAKAGASQSLLTADTAVAALIICEMCALEVSILGTGVSKQAAQGQLALFYPSLLFCSLFTPLTFSLDHRRLHTRHV